jgi:glycosyltransferase involved in cell wall biosynthesis
MMLTAVKSNDLARPEALASARPGPRSAIDSLVAVAEVLDLTVIVPAHNEEGCIVETIRRIAAEAERLVGTYEILIVDDGSTDATLERIAQVAPFYPLRTLRLSRNFGKEQAIMAGLTRSRGQATVIIDADLQEPIHHLETMLKHYREGYEMVYAVRAHREDEPALKRLLTRMFYRVISYGSDVEIPPDARDFRLMDRKVVDAICALPERNRFMKGLFGWVGYKTKAVPIVLDPRAGGASKFGFKRLLRLGLTGLTSFTDWPLRVWTGIGFAFAVLSIVYGLWILAKTLIWGIDVPGWSTITVAVFFLGGIQLLSIGILGEYVARVFTEVKGRPGFIVAEEIDGGTAR